MSKKYAMIGAMPGFVEVVVHDSIGKTIKQGDHLTISYGFGGPKIEIRGMHAYWKRREWPENWRIRFRRKR